MRFQFRLNYENAPAADYLRDRLQGNSFHTADNTPYVGLGFGVNHERGAAFRVYGLLPGQRQQAGIYWTPTDWGCNPRQKMDHAEYYTFGDAYPTPTDSRRSWTAPCADPTHPAVEQRMKYFELSPPYGIQVNRLPWE